MFRTVSRRLIPLLVGFFIGASVFEVVKSVHRMNGAERFANQVLVFQMPAPQISAITLKRLGCSDAELECSVRDVTFRSDGTGTYIGYANDEFKGEYKTEFDPRDFAYLVEQFYKQRFFELAQQQYATVPDEEKIVLEVKTNDGLRVVTTRNWHSTPSELRALHALVDHMTFQFVWEPVE